MSKWIGRLLVFSGAWVACHSSNNTAPITINRDDAGQSTPIAPDGGAACPVGACNYQTQAGCDAGSMCHPQLDADDTVVPACLPVGTSAPGASCVWLGCQPGYICTGEGKCRHLCCGNDWSACASNESCTGAVELLPDGSSTPVAAGVGVCVPTDDCDVFERASCPSGRSCYIVDSRGGVSCLATGSAKAYEGCSSTQLCETGLICVASSNGVGQCRRLCRTTGSAPGCPGSEGTVCKHFSNDPVDVGECVFAN